MSGELHVRDEAQQLDGLLLHQTQPHLSLWMGEAAHSCMTLVVKNGPSSL